MMDYNNFSGVLRRGFLHRTVSALLLCALFGLLLVIPSVSSETEAQLQANVPLYSHWREGELLGEGFDDEIDAESSDFSVGSFSLHRPQSELFMKGLVGELYDIAAAAALESGDIENYLHLRARAQLMDTEVPDFKRWLSDRGEGITERIFINSADYLTDYLSTSVVDNAEGLNFIRTVEWDYQTALGNRRWQTGISALGALRESADDAVAWQLRGYAAEDSGIGANAGLIYRRAVDLGGEALVGANVFLDYEENNEYGEDFLRWSAGAEYRNAHLDIYLNRYFPISDAVLHDGDYLYTQGGEEAYVNLKIPQLDIGQVAGGFTYYRWQGEYGDADDKGLRYHIRYSPHWSDWHFELELDSPDRGGVQWGGRLSYHYTIGSAQTGIGALAAESAFDARAHFFDALRREYAQRIRRSDEKARIVVARVLDDSTGSAQLAILEPAPAATAAVVTLSVVNGVGETHTLTLSARTISITVEMGTTLQLSASNWLATIYEGGMDRLMETGGRLEVVTSTTAFERFGDGLNTLLVGNVTIDLLGTKGKTGHPPQPSRYDLFTHLVEGNIALTVAARNRMSVELFGFAATAFVDLPPAFFAPQDTAATVQLTLACSTTEQRDDHRIFQEDYIGCVGDVRLSDLAADRTVYLHAQGKDLTLAGVAGGGIAAVEAGVTSTIVYDSYPFHPHNATLRVLNGAVSIAHGRESGELAALSVAADSEVMFLFADAGAGATATVAVSIYAAVFAGAVSDIGGGGVVDCVGNSASLSEGLVSVVAACGGVFFGPGDEMDIIGRVGLEQMREVQVTGGGGVYDFELLGADANLLLAAPAGAAAVLMVSPDESLYNSLRVVNAGVTITNSAEYSLRASPRPPFDAFIAEAQVDIHLRVLGDFAVENPAAPGFVRTEIDRELALYQVAYEGSADEQISIDICVCPGPAFDSAFRHPLREHFAAAAGNRQVNVAAAIAPESIAQRAPPNPADNPPTLEDVPLPVTVLISVTDIYPQDEALNAADVVSLTVTVRHPSGDVTATYNYASVERNGNYAVYNRAAIDGDVFNVSDTRNAPDSNGVSVSGISVGGHYNYRVVNTLPAGFVLATADAPGTAAALRIDSASPPALGRYEIELAADDDHSLTEPFLVTASVEIITTLPLLLLEVKGELQPSPHPHTGLNDEVLNKDLLTLTARGGDDGNSGANYEYALSGADADRVQLAGNAPYGAEVTIRLKNLEGVDVTDDEADTLQIKIELSDGGMSTPVTNEVAIDLLTPLNMIVPTEVTRPSPHDAGEELFMVRGQGGNDNNNGEQYVYKLSGADAGRVRFSGNPNGATAVAVEIGDLSDLTLDDVVADRLQVEVILNDGGMSAPLSRVVNINLLAPLALPAPAAVTDGLVPKKFPHAADEELFVLAATGGDGDYTYAIEPALSGADNVVRINGDKAQLSVAVTDNLPRLIEMTIQVTDGANSTAATRVVTVNLLTPLALDAPASAVQSWVPHDAGKILFAVTASGGNGGVGGANYAYELSGRDSGKVQVVGSGGTVEIALENAEPLTNGEAERLQFAVVLRDGKSPAVSENVAVELQPFAVLALTDPGLVILPADSDGHSAGDALFVLDASGGDDRNGNASYEYALSGADADAGRVRFSGNPNGNTAAAVEIGDLSDLTLDDAATDYLQVEVVLNDGGMSAPLPRVVNINLLAPLSLPIPAAVRDGLVHKAFPHAADEELFALAATGGDGDYTYAIEPALSGADNVVRINGDKAELSAAVTDNLPRLIEMTIQVTDGANSSAATRAVTVSLLTPLAVAATPTDLVKSAPHIEGDALFRLQTSGGDGTYNYRMVRGDDGGVIAISKDEVTQEGVFSLSRAVTEEMNLQLLIEVTDTGGSAAVQVVFPLRLLAALVVAGQTEVDKAALHRVDDALFEFSVSGGLLPYNYEIVTAAVAANALLEAKPSGGRVRLTQAVELSDSAQQMVITIDVRDVRGEKQRHEVEVNLLPDYILVIGGDNGGANNDVWRSLDGANWTQLIAPAAQRFPARYSHAAVALSGTVYVSGGSDGTNHLNDVWASANGNHWTLQTQAATADSAESRRFSARSGHDMLAYQGTLFVIGGSNGDINAGGGFASLPNDIWYSVDGGVNWDVLSGAAGACANRTLPLSFVYAERVIVAGGYRAADGGGFALAEDVRAFDGENCGSSFGDLPPPVTAVYGGAAQKHAGVLLDGEMYILGAANVFASAGGGGWEIKTDSAAFGDLSNHAAVVHRGTMFVIGGRAGADVSGRVWVSTTGETWQERTAVAGAGALPGRIQHAAVVLGRQSYTLPPPAPPLVLTGPTAVVKPEETHSLGRELFTVVAAGGAGDYVYSIASASPAGHIGIDAASGVASIAATVDVSTRIIINTRVRDGDNDTADFEVTVDLLRPLVVTGPTDVVYSTAPHIKGRDLFMITVRGGTESYTYGIGAVAPANLAGNFGISGGSVPVAPQVAGGAVTLAVTLAATVATASRAVVTVTVSDGEQTALLDITVQLSAVVNYMLVIGGLNENSDATNDVWLSLDGEQWERLEIQGAMFEERYRHAAAVLGGTVYVSGGLAATGSRYLNDVWASTDGVHWQRKTSNFPSRSNHRMVASGGTLFVMGGVAQDGPRFEVTQRDIWYSTSAGSTWSRLDNERASACNIGRHPLAFAYKEQVLLAGGVILNGFRYEFVNEARSLRANECNDWATLPQGTADAFGSVTDPHLPKVQGVLLGDTMYLMGASDVWSSANGVDWTEKTAGAGFAGAQAFDGGAGDLISHAAVAHNNKLFVIGGRKDMNSQIFGKVWSSADGIAWSEAAAADAAERLPNRHLHAAVALGPQSHIAPPNTPLVVTGPTEVVQSTAPHTEGRFLFAVTARGGAANDYSYSIDGVTPADLEGNFGIGGSGTIGRASPGAAVTLTVTLRATVDAASRATLTIAVSDGIQTAQRGVTVQLSAVIDHILVIGGETGEITGGQGDASNEVWWSADGKAWTLLPAPRSGEPIFEARRRHAGVVVSGTVYISGGRGLDNNAQEITYNDVWASTDGIHWQRRTDTAPSRYNHQMVAYNNTLFIMGGEPQSEQDIWHSSDWGATWQAFTGDSGACNTAYESLLFVYDRYMLIAGGVVAEAQDSTEQDPNRFIPQVRLFDGEQCRGNTGIVPDAMIDDFGTAAGFDAANGWAGALFGNSTAADMYISGRSAVWSSANGGATWTARERDADFSAAAALDGAAGMLEAHALAAFDEKLFIIGGQSGERTRTGNVWSSADGKGWEIRTGAGAATQDFARRSQHVAVVLGTPQPPPPAPVVLTGPTMVVQSQMPPSTGEMLFTLTAYGGSGNYAYGIAAVSPAGYTGINPASGKVSIIARGADMDTSSRVVMTAIVWDPGNGFASVTVTVDLSVPLVVTGPTAKVQSPAPHTKGRDLFAITVRGGYGTRGYNYEVSVVTPAGADTPSPLTYNFGYTVISNSAAAATLMFTLAATVAEPAEATLQIIVNDGNETVEVLVTAALSAAVGHIFVIGGETAQGDSNEVWWSAGGEEWRLLPAGQIFEPRRDHAAIVVSGTIYISGGSSGDGGNRFNDVWASTDGVHWQQKSTAAFTARSKHGMFARNGTLFIIGGEFADGGRDIWRSDDLGETWNPFIDVPGVCDIGADSLVFAYDEYALIVAGKNAQTDFMDQVRLFDGAGCIGSLGRVPQAVQNDFGARSDDLAGVVFNGNMHLLGRSAVWSSPADVAWTRKAENAQFSGADAFGGVAGALTGHAAVVHDGAMFVIGGERSEGNAPGGVWSSANGESWTRRAETAADDSPAERFPFPGRAGHAAVALPYAALPPAPLVLLGPMELLTSRHPHRAGGALFTVVARGGGGTGEYEYVFSPANGNIGIHASGGLATIKAAVTVSTRITLTVVALDDSVNKSASLTVTVDVLPPARVLMFGGQYGEVASTFKNDVWASIDGENWTLLTRSATFGGRTGIAATQLGGTLYFSGGTTNGDDRLHSVWSSVDGVNWTWRNRNTERALRFPGRYHHKMVAVDGALYVLGGTGGNDENGERILFSDLWQSTDEGETWRLLQGVLERGTEIIDGFDDIGSDHESFVAFGTRGRVWAFGRRDNFDLLWFIAPDLGWLRNVTSPSWEDILGITVTGPFSRRTPLLYPDSPFHPHREHRYFGAAGAVFNNRLYMFAHERIFSTVGAGWREEQTLSQYANYPNNPRIDLRRVGHQVVAINGKLLVVGGVFHNLDELQQSDESGVNRLDNTAWVSVGSVGGAGVLNWRPVAAEGAADFARVGHALIVQEPSGQ